MTLGPLLGSAVLYRADVSWKYITGHGYTMSTSRFWPVPRAATPELELEPFPSPFCTWSMLLGGDWPRRQVTERLLAKASGY